MIKKSPYGSTLKEQLRANALDRLHNFTLADGRIRGVMIHATRMVNEMRANHDLGILETLALGHAYMATALMSANLKGKDRIQLKIECSGPIKGIYTEANAFGEVRGYLSQNPIPVDGPVDSFTLSPFFGAGFLTVTKHLEAARQPFNGQIMLEYGNIAQDIANYYITSEQTPTAFSLSVQFDSEGNVIGAGGLFLQAFPDATPEDIERLETEVAAIPSLGQQFADGVEAEHLIQTVFSDLGPKLLDSHRVEFFCRCSLEQMAAYLVGLPVEDLAEIAENGPFPVQITCHNCNSVYDFSKEMLAALLVKSQEHNQGTGNA